MPVLLALLASCTPTSPSPLLFSEQTDPPPSLLGDAPPADTGGWTPGTPLPLVLLQAEDPIVADVRVKATVEIILEHDGTLGGLSDAPRALESLAAVEIRGMSSARLFPKHSYNLELRDDLGADRAVALLGLPPEADWVLYGPYTDKTYVRDALAYGLSRRMGHYAPRVRFAEAFVDGVYAGIYQVTEKVELDPDRVDLPDPLPSGDLSGGYLFKIEGGTDGGAGFTTERGEIYELQDPSEDEITPEQLTWLRGWMNRFEDAIAHGEDPAAWIDVPSFVDFVLVNELSRNVDAFRRSAFLHKAPDAMGGRLHAGPLWDFNIAWGNADFCDGWNPEGLVWEAQDVCEDWHQIPSWWIRVLRDERFTGPLRCRWNELRLGVLGDNALATTIEALVLPLAEAEQRDHARWATLGVNIWPNWYVGATWADELAYLNTFTLARAAWLDGNLPGRCD